MEVFIEFGIAIFWILFIGFGIWFIMKSIFNDKGGPPKGGTPA
jgi:flagellar biogenesis protein FliO